MLSCHVHPSFILKCFIQLRGIILKTITGTEIVVAIILTKRPSGEESLHRGIRKSSKCAICGCHCWTPELLNRVAMHTSGLKYVVSE